MAKIKIAELDINTDALIKATADVKKEIDSLKQAQKELTKNGETSSKQFVKNAADLKVLNSAYNSNVKALALNTKATVDQTQRTELMAIALNDEVKSISEARAQNKLLNKLRNETNATTTKGQEEIAKLNNKLDANNEFVKENSDAYAKQKINIGNYGSALSSVNPKLGAVLTSIQSSIAGLQAQKAAIIGSTGALNGGSKALKVFRLALISTGIGALVVALGSLISFLTTTQAGIDKVTAVTRPLQAIFQSLIGVIQDLGANLFEALSNPKQLLTDLVDFLKGQVINRFKAFGVVLEGIINLDFKKITDGVLQAGTGVEGLTGKLANAGKETAKFLTEAAEKGAEIDRLTKSIEESEINLNKQRAEATTKVKELDKIAKDTSKTTQERLAANLEQNEIAREQAEIEKGIIAQKIERLKIEQTLNDTSREGAKELADLEALLETQNQKVLDEELKGIRVVSQANKELAKQREKAVDNAIKKQQEQLDLFITQQGVRAKTLEEEVELAKTVSAKKISILEAELRAGKISQEKFDKESLDAKQELLDAQTNLTISNAERELSAHEGLNQSKLDSDKFFTDQAIQLEKDRLDSIAEAQREFQKVRLEEGVISQTDYNAAIELIDEDNRVKKAEADAIRKEAEAERVSIDLENQRILDEENFTTQFDLETERARLRYEAEIAAAEKSGADTTLIKKKYDKVQEDIEKSKQDSKIAAAGATFGVVSDILGKETAAGKAAALAQALINTYQGITAGVALGYPAAIPAVAAAAATGFATVKKITSTPKPKFKQGGGIMQVQGKSHAQGGEDIHIGGKYFGEMEGDEGLGIMNKNAMKHFLAFNNEYNTGTSTATTFAGGAGIISQGVSTQSIDTNELARVTQQAVRSLPSPIVTVEDINAGQTGVAEVVSGADI